MMAEFALTLQPSGRKREYEKYDLYQRRRVVTGWLFDGLTHRELDDLALGLDRHETKGYQSMGILHYIGLRGESRALFRGRSFEEVVSFIPRTPEYELLYIHVNELPQTAVSLATLRAEEANDLRDVQALCSKTRSAQLESAPKRPLERISILSYGFRRNPYIVAEALDRANGCCERCKNPAPFMKATDGSPYLEVHHLTPLSQGGEDSLNNVVALCPNCHRELHFGQS